MVPYDNDMSVATTLMEHLKRSLDYIINHKGPHKLPLIGRADWNDCLNLNCFSEHPGESFQTFGPSEGPVAESVFIAGMFVKYGEEYAQLAELLGDEAEAKRARDEVAVMYDAILRMAGTVNGSSVHTMHIATRLVPRNVKKARFTSSPRASVYLPASVSKKDRLKRLWTPLRKDWIPSMVS